MKSAAHNESLSLSKAIFKSCALNQGLPLPYQPRCQQCQPSKQLQGLICASSPLGNPSHFPRPAVAPSLLTPKSPSASYRATHLTHVARTPQLRDPCAPLRAQLPGRCSGVALPPVLAFLLKRAARWHHASRKPMRFIHLSALLADI